MRHQPVIAWVTVLGTALSIFLILIVVMMQNVGLVNIAPESNRDRMLYGKYVHYTSTIDNSDQSSGISLSLSREMYDGLDGVEKISYYDDALQTYDAKGVDGEMFEVHTRLADAGFWEVFDHTLVAGRYFTAEEAKAEAHKAVVSESTARRLFLGENAVGKNFSLDHKTYTVVGVVKDSSRLATMACGDVFIPFPFSNYNYNNDESEWGEVTAALLVKKGVDFEHVRDQVKKRFAEIDTKKAPENLKTVYHEQPYDQATMMAGLPGSNNTPDNSASDMLRWSIYVILLLIPAINLSSMLHSRMRHRVSEIGVRRAYGCTRARIVGDIITENMIVTLVGGVIGLIVAIVFAMCYDGIFEIQDGTASPALGMILNWQLIAAALGACLVLNLISAFVPAWQAARLNPVDAINSNHN